MHIFLLLKYKLHDNVVLISAGQQNESYMSPWPLEPPSHSTTYLFFTW